jgi:hypothetical protein
LNEVSPATAFTLKSMTAATKPHATLTIEYGEEFMNPMMGKSLNFATKTHVKLF